jgi:hypothetical protein
MIDVNLRRVSTDNMATVKRTCTYGTSDNVSWRRVYLVALPRLGHVREPTVSSSAAAYVSKDMHAVVRVPILADPSCGHLDPGRRTGSPYQADSLNAFDALVVLRAGTLAVERELPNIASICAHEYAASFVPLKDVICALYVAVASTGRSIGVEEQDRHSTHGCLGLFFHNNRFYSCRPGATTVRMPRALRTAVPRQHPTLASGVFIAGVLSSRTDGPWRVVLNS